MPNVTLVKRSRYGPMIAKKVTKKDKLTGKKQAIPEPKQPLPSGARPWINQPKR
jgi:hypothetical protein